MAGYDVKSELRKIGYQVRTTTNGHQVLADEPAPAGTDAGPNPVEYLITALNSCLLISASSVAKHRGYDVKNLKVESKSKVTGHPDGSSEVAEIDTTFSFDGLSDDDRKAFFDRTVQVCTVHKSLEGGIKMNIKLAD